MWVSLCSLLTAEAVVETAASIAVGRKEPLR